MAYLGFVCPVPKNKCGGKAIEKDGGKYHPTDKEALRCKENYLKSQGYEKVATRQWREPNGGPVLVLDRRPGKIAVARKGKEGRGMKQYHSIIGF